MARRHTAAGLRRLQALLVLTPLSGCVLLPCGQYVVENTTATSASGHPYNGSWAETCGVESGTSGNWDLIGDGQADLIFWPSDSGDRWTYASDIEIAVGLSTSLLVPGQTIGVDDFSHAGAAVNPCVDCWQDEAGLSSGEIEVLSGWEGGDPCAEDPGPAFRLRWDLAFGDGVGPTYTARGEDEVAFSVAFADPCS